MRAYVYMRACMRGVRVSVCPVSGGGAYIMGVLQISWIADGIGWNTYETDASVLRAARAARVGARAGRLTRVMKIIKALQLQNLLTKVPSPLCASQDRLQLQKDYDHPLLCAHAQTSKK